MLRNSRVIGRRFLLTHVFFGAKHIDTATFRAPPLDPDDDNVFGTEIEDAQRRDFTINGLFYDIEREEVIDHVGGLDDLEAGLVRTIGDPDVRFQEDPLRMLRAIKFAARLDFGIEPATWRALVRWRGEIDTCSSSRLRDEVHRLLLGGAARRTFELMGESGMLAVLSPYLAKHADEHVWGALDRLDRAIAAGRKPSSPVALAVLIAPFVRDRAIDEVVQRIVAQLHGTRIDSEHVRSLLVTQRKNSGGRELHDATLVDALLRRSVPEPANGLHRERRRRRHRA